MKKILLYRWSAYNYYDIIKHFKLLGYDVEEIEYELKDYDWNPEFEEKLEELLKTENYEFVFTVNYFALIAEVCKKRNILYVSWSCDNPLISMHHKSVFYDTNCIFSFDKTNVLEFKEMGVENIYHMPLAVDSTRIDFLIKNSRDLEQYKNEISFVGNLYEKNYYDSIENKLSDYLRGYFEATMDIQSNLFGSRIIEDAITFDILCELEKIFNLEKSENSFSDISLIFSTTVLGFKIARLQRINFLNDLSDYCDVSIYTDSDTSVLHNIETKAPLDYWKEMPKVFYNSKINLNFTIPNIKSGIPLRVWDVLGAGGFLLTNFQAETPMFFEEGKDLVSFYSREDMLEKCEFYLKNDSLRKQISVNGHEKVKKHHSYEARMRQMLEIINKIK